MRLAIRDPEILCIDWDERSLRLLNTSLSRTGVEVRSAVHVPLPSGLDLRDPSALGSFIRRTLGEHRIRSRRVVVDVPRQDAALTLMSLPKGTTDELSAMVHIQIAKDLPFSKDQAVIDFAVAREDEKTGNNDVWVAAVRTSIIDRYTQVIEAAGLKMNRIGLRSNANLVAMKADGASPGRTLMVDVGPSMTEINVIRDGLLVYSRAASVSLPLEGLRSAPAARPVDRPPSDATIPFADDLTVKPGAMDALLVEVSRTIEAYRATDPGAKIDRILLAGTGGIDETFRAAFENRFSLPTKVFEVPNSLRWRGDKPKSAAAFSAAIGLALSGAGESLHHFNFLHPKEPEAGRRERVRRVPRMAVAAGLFIAALGVTAYQPLRASNARIAELTADINKANADEKARTELTNQLKDVDAWQAKNVVWLDTLKSFADDIYTSNEDAYLIKLDCNESGAIQIEMAVVDDKVASDFIEGASSVKDREGQRIFDAKPGQLDDNKHPKYVFNDEVFMQIRALVPKKSRKK